MDQLLLLFKRAALLCEVLWFKKMAGRSEGKCEPSINNIENWFMRLQREERALLYFIWWYCLCFILLEDILLNNYKNKVKFVSAIKEQEAQNASFRCIWQYLDSSLLTLLGEGFLPLALTPSKRAAQWPGSLCRHWKGTAMPKGQVIPPVLEWQVCDLEADRARWKLKKAKA